MTGEWEEPVNKLITERIAFDENNVAEVSKCGGVD
jgi:hypothetical protein